MRKTIVGAVMAIALAIGSGAIAQGTSNSTGRMPGIRGVTRDSAATNVRPNLYYTQVQVSTSPFIFPGDSSGQERLGKAILESLGLRRETRSIIVSLNISTPSATYPDYPLLIYKFDGHSRLTDIDVVGSLTFPLQRLGPNEKITVRLSYRNSDQVNFDVAGAVNAIQGMIPGSTVASLATQPFLGKIANLASSIFSLASSDSSRVGLTDEMGPYGPDSAKTLTIQLAKPDGSDFGTITLRLLATPTLQRPARSVSAAGDGDFTLQGGEDPSSLSLTVGGISRNLVTEVKGLPEYVRLSRDRTREAARDFCVRARGVLQTQFSLTLMDSSLVIYQALRDADPSTNDSRPSADSVWYFACFETAERTALRQAINLNPTEQVVASVVDPAGPIPSALKDAIGCFMTSQTGDWCTARAPNARQTVLNAMAPQVRIGQMDYSDLVDINTLDPGTRLMTRETLVAALAGRANSFSCYEHGLYLGVAGRTRAYNFLASLSDGKITSIQTVAIGLDDLRCTG